LTHFQDIFIRNLRYYRTRAGYSQSKFSELTGVSPNYLNAVENGKNFPSVAVIQKMLDVLQILPYELFLEEPRETCDNDKPDKAALLKQDLTHIKNQFDFEIDRVIRDYCLTNG